MANKGNNLAELSEYRSTIDELVESFTAKQRILREHYVYPASEANNVNMLSAAKLCHKYNMHPGTFMRVIYDSLPQAAKLNFNTKHLQSDNAEKKIVNFLNDPESELNNTNIDYRELWNQQLLDARKFMSYGSTCKEILMDATLNFYAWFRVLATPNRDEDIIRKFGKTARLEMNDVLLKFIREENLDLERIPR
jgi:hypothetical protein